MTAERRKFPRAAVELKVEYKKVNTFLFDYTRNISKGGTFIETDKPLPKGTEFVFLLKIPQMDEPLRLIGRVQWVGEKEDPDRPHAKPMYGMGINFVYESEAERQRIEKRVETLIKEELGELAYQKLMGE